MTAQMEYDRFALPAELENERLHSLEQVQLAGVPGESRLARITQMARAVFDVPMTVISLIDRDTQIVKAAEGLDLRAGVPRSQTVCRATLARSYECPEDPALIIEDLRAVSDFAELPGVVSAGLRFYAGHPLYGPGGHPVGTFCIYDVGPRTLDTNQKEVFRQMAAWAQRELESSDDLERAATVQRQLLPPPLGDLPGYTSCALCIPAYAVGGDFYDHYHVLRGAIFTVADVMGKGLGAAILTATVRSALRGASRAVDQVGHNADLAAAVESVGAQLGDDLARTESFVTLFHARLDTTDAMVRYVDAGHGLALVVRHDGSVESLAGEGLPLGALADCTWKSRDLALEPGDMLVVVSDGLLDIIGADTDIDALRELVVENADPGALCAAVRELATAQPPLDDVTVVAVRRDET